jgi:Spy/CpxP family protein refolding chaperone
MRYSFMKYAAISTITAGIALAQAEGGAGQPTPPSAPEAPGTEAPRMTPGTQQAPDTEAQRIAPDTQQAPDTREESRSVTGRLEYLAQNLNLTASQKDEARAIFDHAKTSAQPVLGDLRQNRMALTAAAKGGASTADIHRLANDHGHLLGELVAIRTQASSDFYRMLTPAQRVKADQMQAQGRQRMRARVRGSGL